MPFDLHDRDIRHAIHGRKLGIDDKAHLVGVEGVRFATETLATTAASTMLSGGTSILSATASGVYEMRPPTFDRVGIPKRIVNLSTAGVTQYVKLVTGTFVQNGLSTNNVCALSTRGAFVEMEYLTTALVGVVSAPSTYFSFSTTT